MEKLRPVIVVLGRNGDILSALPIAYALSQRGQKPFFLVSKACASILDGVSYVEPIEWEGDYAKPAMAILWFRRNYGNHPLVVAQCYMHADQRHLTSSYQKESWRVAGWLDRFGTIPLVLDQRSPEREAALVKTFLRNERPWILVAPDGISSRYSKADELMAELRAKFEPIADITDLRDVKAERVFDLLGLFDRASLLITVDTVHLHLARASHVPVIAITNLGWKGSVPPPNTIAHFDYICGVKFIGDTARDFLASETTNDRKILHVTDIHGTTERHLRARETWVKTGFKVCFTAWPRTARSIHDPRNLPFLRDVLAFGMRDAAEDDLILWTNDDIGLADNVELWLRWHVALWGACSMRRNSSHMGRDLFAFTKKWLVEHWDEIPDFILGAPFWDLALAALIRKTRGIASTKENMELDFFPCETEHRYALHEDHPSDWAGENEYKYPANLHNRKLFLNWTRVHCPTLKLL